MASLISFLAVQLIQADGAFTVNGRTHTPTHTYTHRHTHIHTHTHTHIHTSTHTHVNTILRIWFKSKENSSFKVLK